MEVVHVELLKRDEADSVNKKWHLPTGGAYDHTGAIWFKRVYSACTTND